MPSPVSLGYSMISTKFKVASISDIHLGHHRTRTPFILDNLRRAFPDNDETGELDLIFFAGDVFDRLLSFASEDVQEITFWLMELFDICRRRDIMVRVLEGTPSHDWKQSRIFTTVNRLMGEKVDLKYVDTLSIEHIPRFDMTVLYVPDEWAENDADTTWKQVNDLMRSLALDKVDFACMHGMFTYQHPVSSHACHVMDRYLSIVRHYIFIGHVHNRSQYERILAQGSFDRDTHGQEAPKGHYRVTVEEGQDDVIEFVENYGAKIYMTIDLAGLPLDKALWNLKKLQDYPDGSHFRLVTRRDDELFSSMATVRETYPQYVWTTQLEDLKTQETSLQQEEEDIPQPISITPDNVVSLIQARLRGVDPEVEREALALLATMR